MTVEQGPRNNEQMPRPAFHFTPKRNWMNDPNGMVFDDGTWHLYFQYNPEGPDWGNMSWGHATSSDLLNWTEHEVAFPHQPGEQIFSGSIAASRDPGERVFTAYYTSAYDDGRQAQSRAISTDGGFTWQHDDTNPVLDRGSTAFRDPKLVYNPDADGDLWILVAVEAEARQVLFYSSRNLKDWVLESTYGPIGNEGVVWECPDLVHLKVAGTPDEHHWVLLLSTNPVGSKPDPGGSSMSYIIGNFDGHSFTSEMGELTRLDYGRDFYAGVSFDNAPESRTVVVGWMSNWAYADVIPTAPWRGAMSLPRELLLREIGGEICLVQEPAPFVRTWVNQDTGTDQECNESALEFRSSGHSIFELGWETANAGAVTLVLEGETESYVNITYDPDAREVNVARSGNAAEAIHRDFPSISTAKGIATDRIRLLVVLDGPLLEVFINDGTHVVSDLVVLGNGGVSASVTSARPGPIAIRAVDVTSPFSATVLDPVETDRSKS
ncbi:glycoside hydrolase family 32 protein [Microbacterium sp. MPKO10]|uniref:glycoside hydrolase family 32 protein n=1 Tax=Microbacterium sp. MPKO10 TaxID=2989818 RepID=UPI0022359F5C|nr:glycoside hydrolase family 32 protein [Microbacterium sp. MPKO10]MCW4459831.1 glycoside hydrolase family 32 protein [Microbacterium sp. MPKO10]